MLCYNFAPCILNFVHWIAYAARCHYQNWIKCNAVGIFRISYITFIHTKDAFMCKPNHGFEMPICSSLTVEKNATLLSFNGINFAKTLYSPTFHLHTYLVKSTELRMIKKCCLSTIITSCRNRSIWHICHYIKKNMVNQLWLWKFSPFILKFWSWSFTSHHVGDKKLHTQN